MSPRNITFAALVAAAAVLVVGLVFTIARDRDYESVATVVLTPNTDEPDRISSLLESFERSGTLGTYVELMASDDTTQEARDLGVTITIRAIPDTRAISVIAKGGEGEVQPALESVIDATRDREGTLSDLFTIQTLESPSEPSLAGPSAVILLLATLLLAGFAAVAVIALLRRFAPPERRPLQDNVPKRGPAQPAP